MNEYLKHILTKLTSGRWILTVIGGGVFAYATHNGLIDKQAITAILAMIFISYFQRNDRKNGGSE